MNKENLAKAFKIFVIIMLLGMISLLSILQWKSDLIIEKVLSGVEQKLTDSLNFEEASLDIFGHFPAVAIQIHGLTVGSGSKPLIKNGDVDLVISLWSLIRGEPIVHTLQIADAEIHLYQRDQKWSYDILKPSDQPSGQPGDTLSTKIEKLVLNNTHIHFDNGRSMSFLLEVEEGSFTGGLSGETLSAAMEVNAILSELKNDSYSLPDPFPFELTGHYILDMEAAQQQFESFALSNDKISLSMQGHINMKEGDESMDLKVQWEKTDPEYLKTFLPTNTRQDYAEYRFGGKLSGSAVIQGQYSGKKTPRIQADIVLEDGSIDFVKADETLKGLRIEATYDSGQPEKKQPGNVRLAFKTNAMIGKGLEGSLTIHNPDHPVIDADIQGRLQANLLNLAGKDGLRFEKGHFDLETFSLRGFNTTSSFTSVIQNGQTRFTAGDVQLDFNGSHIEINDAKIDWDQGQLHLDCKGFRWNKAAATGIEGTLTSDDDVLDYKMTGSICEGEVETKGKFLFGTAGPAWNAMWKVKGIEMKSLLESFDQFDQTFITSSNLSGKADIWAESVIPMDKNWSILSEQVSVKSAIDIRDGRLQGMKTLEDFSDYIHIDDLKDIRFNQLRNYLKIENGKVFLPVMFIQSSAVNLSISGQHSFDQDILYHVKLNAGQVAASKLKKQDFRKNLKPARKSGWINLYFVLYNTVNNVLYRQDRVDVISGFEQSTSLKEQLRNELVDKFGYDVYWIEPNEWEDIPEYE